MSTNESNSLKGGRSNRAATIAISGDEGRAYVDASHHIIPDDKSVVHVYQNERSDGISESIPLSNIDTIARSDEERSRVRARGDDTHDRDGEVDVADEVTDQDCRDARDVRYEYTIETIHGTEHAFYNDEMQGSRVLGILRSMDDLADEILTTDDPIVERNSRREYVRLGKQLPAGGGGETVGESDANTHDRDGELVTDGGYQPPTHDVVWCSRCEAGMSVPIDNIPDDPVCHSCKRARKQEYTSDELRRAYDAAPVDKGDRVMYEGEEYLLARRGEWVYVHLVPLGHSMYTSEDTHADVRELSPVDDPDALSDRYDDHPGMDTNTNDDERLMTDGGEPVDVDEGDFAGVDIAGATEDDDALDERYEDYPAAPDDDADDTHDRVEDEPDPVTDEEIERMRANAESNGDDDVDVDDPSDDDGYIRNSDEIRVATGRTLTSRMEHNKEGKWMCTICEAVVKTSHGAKTHFGRSHPDATADDVSNAINRRGEDEGVDFNITEEDLNDDADDDRVVREEDLVIRVYTRQTGREEGEWERVFDLTVASDEKPGSRYSAVDGMNEVLEDARMHRDTYSGAIGALDGVAVGAMIESETGEEPGDAFKTDTIGTVREISDAHGGGCEIELDTSSEYVDGHADEVIRADDRDDAGDVVNNDSDDGGYTSWDAARDDYAEARLQSSPITRADARDSVVEALQDETQWIAIRERSEPGKHYDLHRWDDEDGWQDDASTYISEVTAQELGSKATDTEDAHYRSQLARRNYISQESVNAGGSDDTLIPVANGTINVDEIDLKGTDDAGRVHIDPGSVVVEDMDPDNYFLYRIQTDWDPENADIDGLKSWLKDIIRTENERSVLYELAGHALHPGYPSDSFGIAVGSGGSGKSETLEVIKAMLGGDNVGVRSLQQIESADFAAGKPIPEMRMNINTELSGEQLKSINTLKAYSSGEETEIEPKGKPAYNGYNDATMIFASDSPPRFPTGQDKDALGRRFHPIEFPASYVDDPNPDDPLQLQSRGKTLIQEELRAEERLKAMLYLALDGLVRLLHEGDGSEAGITDTRSRTERINQYESFSDPVHDFARNALIAVEDDSHGIKAQHLKTVFDRFAEEHGHAGKQLSDLYDYISEMPEYPVVRDRSRDNPFDTDRPTRYLGVGFSERALDAWVPETMMRYYGDHNNDDGDGTARETLKEIIDDDSLGRREGVKVEVSNSTDKTSYNRHEEGVLQDESGTIRYYIQAPGITLEEGESYVIRDVPATVGENDETMLQLIPGMSDVTQIERGTDDGQDDLDDGDDDGGADYEHDTAERPRPGYRNDGGDVVNDTSDDTHDRVESDMQELDEAIIDASDGEKSVAAIAGEVSAAVETNNLDVIKSRIAKLKTRGDIIVAGDSTSDSDASDDTHDRVEHDSEDYETTLGAASGDPESPNRLMGEGEAQCRNCGKLWPVVALNGHFEGTETECSNCGETVDTEWNIEERRLNPEHLPDDLLDDGEVA